MAEKFRLRVVRLWSVSMALLALAAPVGAQGRTPDLEDCEELQVEAGHKVAFRAYAEGVQIYRWNGTSWEFVAPEAVLYSGNNGVVGIHYAGPTWQSASGSKVVAKVVDKCIADPDAIPWLLLKKTSSEGPGIFRKVTYIQRLYTVGGLAPEEPGDVVGDEARIPYSAWYVFYRKHR